MKNLIPIHILACMTSLFFFTSCEENTDQVNKAQADSNKEITIRGVEDCDDCPDTPEHCCCVIEIVEAEEPMDLLFCGIYPTTLGSVCGPVSPPSPCNTIMGTSSIFQLDPDFPGPDRAIFCVPTGGSFSIYQAVGGLAKLRMTCTYDETNPIWTDFTINGGTVYYDNTDCTLMPCE